MASCHKHTIALHSIQQDYISYKNTHNKQCTCNKAYRELKSRISDIQGSSFKNISEHSQRLEETFHELPRSQRDK